MIVPGIVDQPRTRGFDSDIGWFGSANRRPWGSCSKNRSDAAGKVSGAPRAGLNLHKVWESSDKVPKSLLLAYFWFAVVRRAWSPTWLLVAASQLDGSMTPLLPHCGVTAGLLRGLMPPMHSLTLKSRLFLLLHRLVCPSSSLWT